jgi:hypothetical protein
MSRIASARRATTRFISRICSGPHPNFAVKIGARIEQENIRADGYQHFDPQEEDQSFTQGYQACVGTAAIGAPRTAGARANFHLPHLEVLPSWEPEHPPFFDEPDPQFALQRRVPETFRLSNTVLAPRPRLVGSRNGREDEVVRDRRPPQGRRFLLVPCSSSRPGDSTSTFRFARTTVGYSQPGRRRNHHDLHSRHRGRHRRIRPARDGLSGGSQSQARLPGDEYTPALREIFQETSITVTYIRRYTGTSSRTSTPTGSR